MFNDLKVSKRPIIGQDAKLNESNYEHQIQIMQKNITMIFTSSDMICIMLLVLFAKFYVPAIGGCIMLPAWPFND